MNQPGLLEKLPRSRPLQRKERGDIQEDELKRGEYEVECKLKEESINEREESTREEKS